MRALNPAAGSCVHAGGEKLRPRQVRRPNVHGGDPPGFCGGSIEVWIFRCFGEDAVEWGDAAHKFGPEGLVVLLAEQVWVGGDGEPRLALEFILELAGAPPRVADEGADDASWLVGVFDGGFGGDPHGPAQAEFFAPPERREGQLLVQDRSTLVDGKMAQGSKFLAVEKIAEHLAGRVVENEARRAVVRAVVGHQDDRAVECAVAQRRIRQQQLAAEQERSV